MTGNEAIGSALGLNPRREDESPYLLPTEARKLFDPEAWKERKKMILVRLPDARFASAAARWCRENNAHKELNPYQRAAAVFDQVLQGEEYPIYFRPQSEWLTCQYDLILATHDIALWANINQIFVARQTWNHYGSPYHCLVSPALLVSLKKFYEEDYQKFETLPLWSPDPSVVRLLRGFCPPCEEKMVEKAVKQQRRRRRSSK